MPPSSSFTLLASSSQSVLGKRNRVGLGADEEEDDNEQTGRLSQGVGLRKKG
jgi:hypothetical protein